LRSAIFNSEKQMERLTFLFIALISILFFGPMLFTEGFTDGSGQYVTVSLKDLFALMGGQKTNITLPQGEDKEVYGKVKDSIVSDVRGAVRESLQAKSEGTVLTDSCIDSVVNQQGNEWMRYIPGKNPADYIRKDSIPCYACNIPT
jgi:hypothetical protein